MSTNTQVGFLTHTNKALKDKNMHAPTADNVSQSRLSETKMSISSSSNSTILIRSFYDKYRLADSWIWQGLKVNMCFYISPEIMRFKGNYLFIETRREAIFRF